MPISSCPSCEIAMEVQSFEDVMFDICPSCRGVWLDRGEMQKVIAHVRRQEEETPSTDFSDPRQVGREPERRRESRERPRSDSEQPYSEHPYSEKTYRKKRKRGLWDMIEEILD